MRPSGMALAVAAGALSIVVVELLLLKGALAEQTNLGQTNGSGASNANLSSLSSAWRQQLLLAASSKQQQSTIQQSGAKMGASSSNSGQAASETQTAETLTDIPILVSTDFPNPNINNAGHEITKILKKFFLHGYDKRVRPNYSGPPALVNVSFHIIGISSVSEVQMDFTTDFYFRQKWFDPRLEFKPVGQIDELCVGAEFAEKIWLPDTFFANEKTATFHKATTENTFIRVAHNGRVYRSIRLTVTCSCPMDLQYFPMDRQRCKIEIESYGYNTRDIDYRWEKGNESVSLDGKIELPQFKVLGFKMGHELQSLSSGDYIRLYCEIHFVRSMGYYLIQIYIPASLIVIISWVSFWLHRNATPARVALGVTTVLTMTTLMSSTNAALPKISYIKSIDVFLGTCFVMVFASLLEYASVGYIGKRIAMKRKRQQDLKQMQQHHQRVCVAAAASAAAAAVAARQTNPVGVAPAFALKRGGVASGGRRVGDDAEGRFAGPDPLDGPVLVRRFTPANSTAAAAPTLPASDQPPGYHSSTGHRSTIKIVCMEPPEQQPSASIKPARPSSEPQQQQQQQPDHQQQGQQNKQEEVVKICGLTPSAIDKYSRVVFPICFVCFNLMYWIIYGHISQQIDDHGPPLIPFIKG